MKLFNLIKNKGIKYVFKSVCSNTRKNLFIFWTKLTYRGPDKATHSQYAEDLFIDKILGYKKSGCYIDVGANHPEIISNTKKFYDQGWAGVCIEPNYCNYQLFLQFRPNDLNINAGLGKTGGEMVFYNFTADTLSTFSKEVADKTVADGQVLVEKIPIKILTMNDVFLMINKNKVDLISIDTEGFNHAVLAGNDWNKNRARVICIEDESGHDYDSFFSNFGYRKVCHNGLNTFFLDTINFGY